MRADGCGSCGVEGQNEDAGEGESVPRILARGPSKTAWYSQYLARSPTLNERPGPDAPMWWLGDRVSLALGLGCPQSPALRDQAPLEGPVGGRSRVRVSTQEAHRAEPNAVWRVEWWT